MRRRPPTGRGSSAPLAGDDFDFESSNARFSKEKLIEEVQPEEAHEETPGAGSTVYNKTASFFDNLSCETLERQESRDDRRQKQSFADQRKIDTETFGTANVRDGRNTRGRGRGGRGGRGYHGGGQNRGEDRRDNRVFRPVNNANQGAQNGSPSVPKDEQPKPEITAQ